VPLLAENLGHAQPHSGWGDRTDITSSDWRTASPYVVSHQLELVQPPAEPSAWRALQHMEERAPSGVEALQDAAGELPKPTIFNTDPGARSSRREGLLRGVLAPALEIR